ncbi:hypothetical protein KP509_23G077900 [Ceratopteris richardii]|uniref:Uncharacterized protein n=1 Tax=Ceratopteris richardii TaxID=49495 RepID=A0A8T2S411_CERRI|nr:hypothetical protein KP509_23G077900 [Ceratopteris richardii]
MPKSPSKQADGLSLRLKSPPIGNAPQIPLAPESVVPLPPWSYATRKNKNTPLRCSSSLSPARNKRKKKNALRLMLLPFLNQNNLSQENPCRSWILCFLSLFPRLPCRHPSTAINPKKLPPFSCTPQDLSLVPCELLTTCSTCSFRNEKDDLSTSHNILLCSHCLSQMP